jgi:uncharacterized membrane protein
MEKIKKIAKYTTNILAILGAIFEGLVQIWNIPYGDKISATIIVILGVLGTYLTGDKVVAIIKNKE